MIHYNVIFAGSSLPSHVVFQTDFYTFYQGCAIDPIVFFVQHSLGMKYHYILITNRIYVHFYLIFRVRLFQIYLFGFKCAV